jgi:hypothetical protein
MGLMEVGMGEERTRKEENLQVALVLSLAVLAMVNE